jgi:hypothetical protein
MIDNKNEIISVLTASVTAITKVASSISNEEALKDVIKYNFTDYCAIIADTRVEMPLSRPQGFHKYEIEYDILLFVNKMSSTSDIEMIENVCKNLNGSDLNDTVIYSYIVSTEPFEALDTGNLSRILRYAIIKYKTINLVSTT